MHCAYVTATPITAASPSAAIDLIRRQTSRPRIPSDQRSRKTETSIQRQKHHSFPTQRSSDLFDCQHFYFDDVHSGIFLPSHFSAKCISMNRLLAILISSYRLPNALRVRYSDADYCRFTVGSYRFNPKTDESTPNSK